MSLPSSSETTASSAARVIHDGREFSFVHSDPEDHLISVMRKSGAFYEAELLAALGPLVPSGSTVVDVGANIGNHSVFFAGVMGCRVIAIEPNPAAAVLLAENLELNGLSEHVQIRRCAVGATRRKGQITDAGAHNLGMAAVRPDAAGDIEIVPLDELGIEGEVALLKIDVEGAEYDVLSGATALLKAYRPVLVLEIALVQDYRRIAALLGPLGYVPVGSYNYTPTHVFRVPGADEAVADRVVDISHRLSTHYIDAMERTAGVDRRLSKLWQQVGQLSEADRTAAVRLDSAERDRARETDAVKKAFAEQEAKASAQLNSLSGEMRAAAARLDSAESLQARDAETILAVREGLSAEAQAAAQRQTTLVEALHGITGRLEALGSAVAGLRGELARIGSAQEEQDRRFDGIEARIAEMRKAARRESGMAVELQLLAATEADARFERLAATIETMLGRALEERLSDRLRHRFAELTSQLTEAIGTAIADRELADEIADPAGPFDIAKAMAVLGIAEPVQAEAAPAPAKRDVWFVKGYSDKARLTEPRPAERLVELDFRQGWDGRGWGQGSTMLEAGGLVRAEEPCPRLGFVGPMIDCAGGGLIEVEVEMGEGAGDGGRPILRLQTEAGFPVGHDFALSQGVTTVRTFAPHRTKQLKPYVLRLDAPAGASFTIARLTVRRLDGEQHRREVQARVREPVLASMATIPSRREMLRDCVASLLLQCDRVRVFLNNYPDVPDFLIHPRIEVRRSQDWDDRGDAGKFFWIDKDRDEGGYRVVADDDLIFPPDFVEVMTGKVAANGRRAIFATHGVLLRQPIARYYEPGSRAMTFHFGHALPIDRGIHIGATNALCFHVSAVTMRWDDFKYCNSADVWLSLHARRNGLPILTPARPQNWVRENTHAVPGDTIYHHSLKRTRTRFDSSHVQDAVLRRAWPLTLTTRDRAKIAIVIAAGTAEGLRASAEHWLEVAGASAAATELVVILAYDGGDAEVADAVAALRIAHETHLVDVAQLADGLGAKLEELRERLGLEALLGLHEQVRANLATKGGDTRSDDHGPAGVALRQQPRRGRLTLWSAARDEGCLAFALSDGERGTQALSGLLGGDGLIAAPARPKRKRRGFVARDLPPEANGSPGIKAVGKARLAGPAKGGIVTVNDVFQRVAVLNLDRRPDRWKTVSERLARAGIVAERFSAIDGTAPGIAEDYAAYAAQPLHTVSPELPGIVYSRDLYMGYASQMARIAHLEATSGRKAIASAGAWGYLRSYEAILERSLDNQDETLLVLDDDVVFHNDFKRLFAEAVAQLPDDWLIVQLGTLQYNWDEPWAQWRTPMLYQTNGAAIGSHAVGMRFEVLPYLLDHTRRMDIPYDVGPLSAATRAFPDRCFVIYPNLAIQALGDSDIGTSEFQKTRTMAEVAATHRWNLDDYILPARAKRARRP